MVHKIKGRVIAPLAEIGSGRDASANSGAGVTVAHLSRAAKLERFTLKDFVVSMTAANDFGGTKLCDLPSSALIVVGAVVDLTAVVVGLATNTVDQVDLAVGSVTTASTTFANAGEDDIVEKIDGVGAAATGTIKGNTNGNVELGFFANGAKSVFVNCSSPVTSGTGTVTLSGTIDLILLDIGVPA